MERRCLCGAAEADNHACVYTCGSILQSSSPGVLVPFEAEVCSKRDAVVRLRSGHGTEAHGQNTERLNGGGGWRFKWR